MTRKTILWTLTCFLFSWGLWAQPRNKPVFSYQEAIKMGDTALNSNRFGEAIDYYFAAQAFEPDSSREIRQKVLVVFNNIQRLRLEAEQTKRNLEESESKLIRINDTLEAKKSELISSLSEAETAKDKARENEKIAIKAQKVAEDAELKAQKNLKRVNRLIKLTNTINFYEDRFAVAKPEVIYGNSIGLGMGREPTYYFVDKEANKVKKLGEWAYAEQFNDRGLAKVIQKSGGIDHMIQVDTFLIDTFGTIYFPLYPVDNDYSTIFNPGTKTFSYFNGKDLDSVPEFRLNGNSTLGGIDLSNNHLSNFQLDAKELKNLVFLYLKDNDLYDFTFSTKSTQQLKQLDLSNNVLKDFEVGRTDFPLLEKLYLSENNLVQFTVPANALPEIRELNLANNSLTTFILPKNAAPKLSSLDLSGNPIDSIYLSKKILKNLEKLNLSSSPISTNKLKNIDFILDHCDQLSILELEQSQIEELVITNDHLPKLESLSFNNSRLSKFEVSERGFPILMNLELLWVSIDSFHVRKRAMPKLKNLMISSDLKSIVLDSNTLADLQNFILYHCDALEEFILGPGALASLKNLDIAITNVSTFHVPIGALKECQYLRLPQLDSFSIQEGALSNLTQLKFWNFPAKKLPLELSSLNSLSEIRVSVDDSADIQTLILLFEKNDRPIKIGSFSIYNEYDQNGLDIFCSLPEDQFKALKKLSNLTILGFSLSDLKMMPEAIFDFVNLKALDLSLNELKKIPDAISELKELTHLDLRGNYLESLPVTISQLKNLKYLNLIDNPISDNEKIEIQKLLPKTEIVYSEN